MIGTGWVAVTQRVIGFRQERGDYLDGRWARLLAGHRILPVPGDVAAARFQLEGVPLAAIVLTGGNDLSGLPGADDVADDRDRIEQHLLELATECRIPVGAICRGAQLIARSLGAQLGDDAPGHAGTRHTLTATGSVPAAWHWPGQFDVASHHRYTLPALDRLPADLVALATAADGTVEAFTHRTLPWLGLMWHPEREDPASGRGPASRALLHLLNPTP
ncbi:gamma-glutamyl-gamma-aminobutyrate hydrolase family protein [Kitasatospora indigofera]|uniref:gamma-glutamyl-gamma-aminobutyrate hydrolase family protein n=1 Tax=Kitasatospora indigofera TaxID=67307 RepID=UPI0036BE4EF0